MLETFGCKISQVDLRDYRLSRICTLSEDLPETYEISMTHHIKSQGSVCSCTAHALSSILEYHDRNVYTLSTNFIYGLQKMLYNELGPGQKIRVALNIANKYGDPIKALCYGNTEVDAVYDLAEESFKDQEVLNDAYRHKIKSYVKLTTERDIKYALMNYGPVIAGIKWYNSYHFNEATLFLEPDISQGVSGHHAIMIYGWNESGWLCQNSWGPRWGNNGLFRIKYDYGVTETYGVIDDEDLSSDHPEIVKPVHNSDILEIVLKFISRIINLVLGRK